MPYYQFRVNMDSNGVIELDMSKDHSIYKKCMNIVRDKSPKEEMTYVSTDKNVPLLKLVKQLLDNNNHKVPQIELDEYDATIEIHQAMDMDGSYESPLEIHLESDGDFTECETFICYLENTGEGGELGIYSSTNPKSLIRSIDTHPKDDSVKCVIFDETVYHCPKKFSNGVRTIVAIHIKCTRK